MPSSPSQFLPDIWIHQCPCWNESPAYHPHRLLHHFPEQQSYHRHNCVFSACPKSGRNDIYRQNKRLHPQERMSSAFQRCSHHCSSSASVHSGAFPSEPPLPQPQLPWHSSPDPPGYKYILPLLLHILRYVPLPPDFYSSVRNFAIPI